MFGVLAAFGAARIKDAINRNVRLAALYAGAGVLFVCGVGYFLGALQTYLAGKFGPIVASLAMGGGFVALGLILLVTAKIYAGRAQKNSSALAAAATAAIPVAASLSSRTLASKSLSPKIIGILGALAIGGILGRQIVRKNKE